MVSRGRTTLQENTIGILPPGALGVAQFYWLTKRATELSGNVCFLEKQGSRSAQALRQTGFLSLREGEKDRHIPLDGLCHGTLQEAFEAGTLPEVILVSTNPDQLLDVVREWVAFVEHLSQRGLLEPVSIPFPKFVLCSNGIYFQRIRAVFIETLEEATLLGRLPDLWPDVMPHLVARILRGVTIQTSLRIGSGANAIYRPGPPGLIQIAGTVAHHRQRIVALLQRGEAPVTDCEQDSPTFVEFEKALVNLAGNFLGMIYSIDDDGTFSPKRLKQIYLPENLPDIRQLVSSVIQIGKAVRAVRPEASVEEAFEKLLGKMTIFPEHKVSSVQFLEQAVLDKRPPEELTPTEKWILQPLQHYARSANLEGPLAYLDNLERRLLDKFTRLRQKMSPHSEGPPL
jgi:hypothetical protein